MQAEPKFIRSPLGLYYKAVETKEFIYYCNYKEPDENANVKMYRRDSFELVSDNYFAYNDMFTVLIEKTYTKLSPTMKKNAKLYNELYN